MEGGGERILMGDVGVREGWRQASDGTKAERQEEEYQWRWKNVRGKLQVRGRGMVGGHNNPVAAAAAAAYGSGGGGGIGKVAWTPYVITARGGGGLGGGHGGGGGGWSPSLIFLEQPLERENAPFFLQMTARVCGGGSLPLL